MWPSSMNKPGFSTHTPVDSVQWEYRDRQYEILIKRDDLIHPFVSGNKWRKLKYNLDSAGRQKARKIVTYGGAFSNHLIATAYACSVAGIPNVGIVRGDELDEHSNYVLRMCHEFGMDLQFVSRAEYDDIKDQDGLSDNGEFHIPEGGANQAGIKGCEEIFDSSWFDHEVTDVVCGVGTSTTFIGLIRSIPSEIHIHGIAALREADYLKRHITEHINGQTHWILHTEFARKGFGQIDETLTLTMQNFTSQTGILLDPVYTGKGIAAIEQMYDSGQFTDQNRVLFLHTGGMTGLLSNRWLKS